MQSPSRVLHVHVFLCGMRTCDTSTTAIAAGLKVLQEPKVAVGGFYKCGHCSMTVYYVSDGKQKRLYMQVSSFCSRLLYVSIPCTKLIAYVGIMMLYAIAT